MALQGRGTGSVERVPRFEGLENSTSLLRMGCGEQAALVARASLLFSMPLTRDLTRCSVQPEKVQPNTSQPITLL